MGKNNYCSITDYYTLDEKYIIQNYDEDNNRKLCFLLSNSLINNTSIKAYVNGKECDCNIFGLTSQKKYPDYSLAVVDFLYSELERNTKCDIAFAFASKDGASVMLKGVIGIYENKFENIIQTAFDRIKSEKSILDLQVHIRNMCCLKAM